MKLQTKYFTPIQSIEIMEAEGQKKVILRGKLMNNLVNSNKWKAHEPDLTTYAQDLTDGVALKVQHSKSDWEVIGTSINGRRYGGIVYYVTEVAEPKAIEKFETGTWNEKNMGVSPSITYKKLKCSCGAEFTNPYDHDHKPGDQVGKEIIDYTPIGGHLTEMSITSNPAYKESGAGTIDAITFAASLDEMLKLDNGEAYSKRHNGGRIMEDNFKEILSEKDKVIAEKDKKINELSASVKSEIDKIEQLDAEFKGVKNSLEEKNNKMIEMDAELKATKDSLGKYIKASREEELKKRIDNPEIVSEILNKDMSDEEFKSELKKIDLIQANTKTNAAMGSVPADKKDDDINKRTDEIGAELFGENYKKLIGKE